MQRLLPLVLVASACGESQSGSRTLRVEGNVVGSGTFATVLVRIWKDDVPVRDATVTVTSPTGSHELGSDPRFPGRWSLIVEPYERDYVLDIESGADAVRNVRVDGPQAVAFTTPTDYSTIDPTAPFEFHWMPESADSLSLTVLPQSALFGEIVDDAGSFTIPANTLLYNPAGLHSVWLTRTNTVTPDYAVEGSWWSVSTEAFLRICDRPTTGVCPN